MIYKTKRWVITTDFSNFLNYTPREVLFDVMNVLYNTGIPFLAGTMMIKTNNPLFFLGFLIPALLKINLFIDKSRRKKV